MSYLCSYLNKVKRTLLISKIFFRYLDCSLNDFLLFKKSFNLVGRIINKRIMGKVSFFVIQDVSGKIQLYLSKKFLFNNYKKLISCLNLGDIISVNGYIFKTRTNELSLRVFSINILTKNYNNFPDKWFGIQDKNICYRNRYLDLMVNIKTLNLFIIRSKIIKLIRDFFMKRNYIEVETPIMQKIPGGADARPFKTYSNYLNSNFYLRISPELFLKKLIVGGFDRVFEIGKNFRNEGISNKHNSEFTMIEFYQAYSTYKDLMVLTELLFKYISENIFNRYIIYYNIYIIDFSKKFYKINFIDSILKYNVNLDEKCLYDLNKIKKYLFKQNIDFDLKSNVIDLQCLLFEKTVEKNLIIPTFILHYPRDISPLSRSCNFNSKLTERFELYICGMEIANGFSELNDPFDQSNRFLKQLKDKNVDSKFNKLYYDEDYINALKYGLPPTAGEGIGIDRLVMLFLDASSIKDVILFPIIRE